MSIGRKIGTVVKGLMVSYAITGILLVLLAFLVYKFKLAESVTDIAIIVIYVVVTFFGAFVVGKKVKNRKFLWGFLLGFLYIAIITLVAWILSRFFPVSGAVNWSAVALCIGGGLLGGMLS